MNKILSLDEVDALLKSHVKEENRRPNIESKWHEYKRDARVILVNAFCESFASTFSALTGLEFYARLDSDAKSMISVGSDQADLIMSLTYNKGIKGNIFFLLYEKPSLQLADLLVGGDGLTYNPDENLEEDDKDVLAEAFCQITECANQTISDAIGESVSGTHPVIKDHGAVLFPEILELNFLVTHKGFKIPVGLAVPVDVYSQLKNKGGCGEENVKAKEATRTPRKEIPKKRMMEYLKANIQMMSGLVKMLEMEVEDEVE